jgi:hypothetical protein
MAREKKEREIDGLRFEVTQMGARKAQEVLVRVSGILAPALGKAIAGAGKASSGNVLDTQIDLAALGDALPALFQRLTPRELEDIQKELLENAYVTVGGQEQRVWTQWDSVMPNAFTGLKLTAFAFEVNFGNFFEGLGGRVAALAAGLRPSISPKNSPASGASGASSSNG